MTPYHTFLVLLALMGGMFLATTDAREPASLDKGHRAGRAIATAKDTGERGRPKGGSLAAASRSDRTSSSDGTRSAQGGGGDTCGDAIVIGSLPYMDVGDTTGYFHDYDEVCPYTGSTAPDVVYSYTAECDETVAVSLCGAGSCYDTKLYVYDSACQAPGDGNDPFACMDDSCPNPCTSYGSDLSGLALTGGTTYYFVVDGYGGDFGPYQIDVTSGGCDGGGGDCADDWTDNFESYADSSCLHGQGGWEGWGGDPAWDACLQEQISHSANSAVDINGDADLVRVFSGYDDCVWNFCSWQYIPEDFSGTSYYILLNGYPAFNWSTQISMDSASGNVTSETENNSLPMILGSWVELCVEIDLISDVQTITYDGELLSTKNWTEGLPPTGTLNFAAVDLFANGASSIYYDDFSLIAKSPADGDECEDCSVVGEGTFEGTTDDNTGSTGDDTALCAFEDDIDEWYCYTAGCSGVATASLCGSMYDTTLAVYDACDGTELACNDDACGLQSELSWEVEMGTTYNVRVSGFFGSSGDYTLDLSCDPSGPVCGDTICNGKETCKDCEEDCGVCPPDCPLSSCVCNAATLTQSNTTSNGNNQVACGAEGNTTENGWARCYDLAAEGFSGDVTINSVTFGVQQATIDGIVVNVNLYLDSDGCPPAGPGGDAILLDSVGTVVNTADEGSLITLNFPGGPMVPADSTLIVEIEAPADGTEEPLHAFRCMSNPDGQCGSSYIRAADCGFADWAALEDIDFPDAHLVQIINGTGECEGGGGGCNANGIPDECDIAGGGSDDCNGNGIPDECEEDCNANGIPDDCDIAGGGSDDCNGNGVPDECEPDCNANGTPDECDIAGGGSDDCNGNGVPDECEPDCNANGIADECDIAGGGSDDCNGNGIPDECEIDEKSPAPGGPFFCVEDCDPDCNDNGIPDECDMAECPPDTPSCDDCNVNGILDGCDVDPEDPDGNGHTSDDGNGDGVPDECIEATGSGDWSGDIWALGGDYPDNDPKNPVGVPDLSVTIDGEDITVLVDVTVEVPSLRLITAASLDVTQDGEQGDLTIFDPNGELDGNLLIEGTLTVGGDRVITAAGKVTIGAGGSYKSAIGLKGPASGDLQADALEVKCGGSADLQGSMHVETWGDIVLKGDDKGDCTPPDFDARDETSATTGGDFAILGSANIDYSSSEPLHLGGDFDNQSTDGSAFDWSEGGILLNGPMHTFEAAGRDRGPCLAGLVDNFAIGTLTLAADTNVQVVDAFDNQDDGTTACDEALYLDLLEVSAGATLLTEGCRVYFKELALAEGGSIPGLGTDVLQILQGCGPDFNGDGVVDAFDLAFLLGNWGDCPEPCTPGDPADTCSADVDGDCQINAFDLATLLGSWG